MLRSLVGTGWLDRDRDCAVRKHCVCPSQPEKKRRTGKSTGPAATMGGLLQEQERLAGHEKSLVPPFSLPKQTAPTGQITEIPKVWGTYPLQRGSMPVVKNKKRRGWRRAAMRSPPLEGKTAHHVIREKGEGHAKEKRAEPTIKIKGKSSSRSQKKKGGGGGVVWGGAGKKDRGKALLFSKKS